MPDMEKGQRDDECSDCGVLVPEAEQHELVNGDGPLCRECWLTYPIEGEEPAHA